MFGWTTAELFIRHFIRQPEHGEGQRAHKLLIVLVGVAGFEPATPSSRTSAAAGKFNVFREVWLRSRPFVHVWLRDICRETVGRRLSAFTAFT